MTTIETYTVQFRNFVRTIRGFETVQKALQAGFAHGNQDPFDVSNKSGAIVWAWEMRPDPNP